MYILVRNDVTSVKIDVSHRDSIASVKAAYISSGKFRGKKDYVVLLHKGKELNDESLLSECGITNGSILVHIEAAHDPFGSVNYSLLSDSVKSRRHHQEESLRMLQQENIWAADENGTVRHLGTDKSIISSNSKSPRMSIPSTVGTRAFFNQLSVRVGSCCFHIIPRMEGRWNGEMASIPGQDEGTQVCSSELLFRENDGVWSQRQMRTSIDGLTHTTHYWLKPLSDGLLKVETDDHALRTCDVLMKEEGSNIVLVTSISKRSGKVISVETITLVDSSRRLRTTQFFDESGAFRYVYCMHEQRVVDAVSGAMEKYDPLR